MRGFESDNLKIEINGHEYYTKGYGHIIYKRYIEEDSDQEQRIAEYFLPERHLLETPTRPSHASKSYYLHIKIELS